MRTRLMRSKSSNREASSIRARQCERCFAVNTWLERETRSNSAAARTCSCARTQHHRLPCRQISIHANQITASPGSKCQHCPHANSVAVMVPSARRLPILVRVAALRSAASINQPTGRGDTVIPAWAHSARRATAFLSMRAFLVRRPGNRSVDCSCLGSA